MKRMLFNATYQEELRVATVDGQKLVNFDIETSSKAQRRGNIYKGVITRVESSLEACFVDYGTEKQGFLPFKEIDPSCLPENLQSRGGLGKLTEGIELIVQVEKDERGNKGAALTTRVSLPGRYLVLMPSNSRSSGISRRIDGEERDELRSVLSVLEVPDGMSIIARTAALGRVQEELQWDLNYLVKLWDAIKTAASSHAGSFLIYQESNLVVRSIRDHFSPDIVEVLIDTEEIYEQAKQFISHVIPAYVDRVKLYNDDVPLFSRFQIEHQIESAYGRMVHLPSGGSIAIDMTEALTAIDVNSARANKGADIEATALSANLEAADEIARQMRLRDLGGLVVVDFIDMENPRNQREVENFFKQQLSHDRARIQMGKLSKFGLLELSRQRLQTSLEESTTIECPRCAGVGTIRGIESNAVHILRIIQEEAVKNGSHLAALHIQVPVPIATYLLNEKRDDVAKIENRMKVKIVLVPNVHLDSPHYKIRKIGHDSAELHGKLSFNLVDDAPDVPFELQNATRDSDPANNKAIVKNFAPGNPAPVMSGASVFGKFFAKVVGAIKTSLDKKPEKASTSSTTTTEPRPRTQGSSYNRSSSAGSSGSASRPTTTNRPPRAGSTGSRTNSNTRTQAANATGSGSRGYNNPNSARTAPANRSAPRTAPSPAQQLAPTPQLAAAVPQPAPSTPVTQTASVAIEKPEINQSWQQPASTPAVDAASATVAATKPAPRKAVAPRAATKIEAPVMPQAELPLVAPSVVPEAPKPVVKPRVVRENKIVEKVDLGELQMVGTDSSLATAPVPQNSAPRGKRYKDVVVEKPVIDTNIEYEMVETK